MDYTCHSEDDIKRMLEAIGVSSIEELFESVPEKVRFKGELRLPGPMSEMELRRYFEELSCRNATDVVCFAGGGCWRHFVPTLVDHLANRAEFYTAYTPYQAEASQGTLQTIFEYQSCICELTEMDVSNASHYDGAAATAEAAIMLYNAQRKTKKRFVVSRTVHPEHRQTLKTYCAALDAEIVEVDYEKETGRTDAQKLKDAVDENTACVVFAQPNFFGVIEDTTLLSSICKDAGVRFVAVVEPISLALLEPPGAYGADVAVGDGQPLGNYMSFGGPAFGFFAAKQEFLRRMPGRIAGQTVDRDGKVGYVLTFQTREQHIRREKATSNICTNQALCAMRALIYLVAMGPKGLREVAEHCLRKAHFAAELLKDRGVELPFSAPFFKEFVVRVDESQKTIRRLLNEHKILVGPPLSPWFPELTDCLIVAVTERNSREEIERLADALAG
ncbi:MAG: aminomethyl-transferring glycine dehydrogenase subunit GcvPA [Planctomycetota bacterium]|nr:MAG: aminomethyl-transferring glycine dehydrogenase subunit GcvPA [Planctomycetota bacterium]